MYKIFIISFLMLCQVSFGQDEKAVKRENWYTLYSTLTKGNEEEVLQLLYLAANESFEKSDSLYATSVAMLADYFIEKQRFISAFTLLEPQMIWLKENAAEKAKDLHKAHAHWALLYGNTYVYLGKMYQGIDTCKEEGLVIPENEQERYVAAVAAYQTAIETYLFLSELRPDHPDLKHNLGVTYRFKGEVEGRYLSDLNAAEKSFNWALRYMPEDAEIYRMLGVVHGIKGETEKAIAVLENYTKKVPENAYGFFNLAIAYEELAKKEGNKKLQKRYFAKSKKLKKKSKKLDPSVG